MNVTMWRRPFDGRYSRDFKVRDLVSARIFMEDCLIKGQTYYIPDANDPEMYFTLEKDNEGQVTFAHTQYGLIVELTEYDDIDRKIYRARKSINKYFFTDEN